MRNILMTVMLLVAVAMMFNTIIAQDNTGTKARIENQGTTTNNTLETLTP